MNRLQHAAIAVVSVAVVGSVVSALTNLHCRDVGYNSVDTKIVLGTLNLPDGYTREDAHKWVNEECNAATSPVGMAVNITKFLISEINPIKSDS